MNTLIDSIDIEKQMSWNDFYTLFSVLKVKLTSEEEIELKEFYFKMYELFITNGTDPKTSWIAVKNIFIVKKGPELVKRMEDGVH